MQPEFQYEALESAGIAESKILKAADALVREHPIVPAFIHSNSLTDTEADFLKRGGAKGVNTAAIDISHDNAASIVGEYGLLVATALTQEQVAQRLAVSASRVRQKLGDGSLYSIATEQGRVCPRWQFVDNRTLPGIEQLLAHLGDDCHPVIVSRFMTSKNNDLVSKDFNETFSPVEWLSSGHPVEPLLPLIEEL